MSLTLVGFLNLTVAIEGSFTWQNHTDISNFASKFQISVKFHSNFIFLYFKFCGKFHKNLARLTLAWCFLTLKVHRKGGKDKIDEVSELKYTEN